MEKMENNEATKIGCDHKTDQKCVKQETIKPLDGGWGWIIVIGSFFINFISDGIMCSFGVIYVQLLKEFNEGKGYTSWILSLMSGMALCAGPISSSFVDKYGFRAVTISGSIIASASLLVSYYAQNVFTLIITIGFGLGCGLGMVYLPAIVSVTTYFEKYRSVAVGIAVSGSGLGTFIMAPLVNYFNKEFGWRGTLVVLSGIVLNCVIFGGLFRPLGSTSDEVSQPEQHEACQKDRIQEIESPQNEHPNENSSKEMCCQNVFLKVYKSFVKMLNLELLKDPVFVLFAMSDFATSMGYYVPYFCLADQAIELGVPKEHASHLLSVIGIVNTLSRIMWGFVSDIPWINRLWVYNICLIICGIATVASVFCINLETLLIYSAIFGFTIGGYVALRSVILVDLLGLEKLNNAFGLLMLFEGIATFIGPPIVGFLYDVLHSYTPGFILAGGMIGLSGLILFFLPLLQRNISKSSHDLEMS